MIILCFWVDGKFAAFVRQSRSIFILKWKCFSCWTWSQYQMGAGDLHRLRADFHIKCGLNVCYSRCRLSAFAFIAHTLCTFFTRLINPNRLFEKWENQLWFFLWFRLTLNSLLLDAILRLIRWFYFEFKSKLVLSLISNLFQNIFECDDARPEVVNIKGCKLLLAKWIISLKCSTWPD